MIKDLRTILDGWEYEPGKISVRKIIGRDRREKIQARVDLGLMQFEVEGRPDGTKPGGSPSLLDLHGRRLAEHIQANGNDEDFVLSAEECQEIRHETYLYHQRFVAEFVLEDYDAVERDTDHAQRAIDLCAQYAVRADDRAALRGYRNYVFMMNVRAKALRASRQGSHDAALAIADAGLEMLRAATADENGEEEAAEPAGEIELLEELRHDIIEGMPDDALPKLHKQLAAALAAEDYEEAARIRDRLSKVAPA